MTRSDSRPRVCIEPLSKKHSCAAFSCGVRRIDAYLRAGAELQEADLARLFVAVESAAARGVVLGFYALHNMEIEARAVPPPLGMQLRRNAVAGAIYIAMLAVDRAWQGRGIGSRLLADALRRCKRVSLESGTWCVVLDALNEPAE